MTTLLSWSDHWRELAWRARTAWSWSPRSDRRTIGQLGPILAGLGPAGLARVEELAQHHDLMRIAATSTLIGGLEALWALDVLDRVLPPDLPKGIALDIGSKNASLLPGLWLAEPRVWDLVEIDAHRRYLSGATRRAWGEEMAERFPGARFIAGDVRALPGPYALVTWFLPFVFVEPLTAWGLPARLFDPGALLAHALRMMAPGAAMLIVNQGAAEAGEQQRLLDEHAPAHRASWQDLGLLESSVSPYAHPRYGCLVRKTG